MSRSWNRQHLRVVGSSQSAARPRVSRRMALPGSAASRVSVRPRWLPGQPGARILWALLVVAAPARGRGAPLPRLGSGHGVRPAALELGAHATTATGRVQTRRVSSQEAPSVVAERAVRQATSSLRSLAIANASAVGSIINETAEGEIALIRKAMDKMADDTNKQRASAASQMFANASKGLAAYVERSKEAAAANFDEIRDHVEDRFVDNAIAVVDSAYAQVREEVKEIKSKSNAIQTQAHQLTEKTRKAATMSIEAARTATLWAEKLPYDDMRKAGHVAEAAHEEIKSIQNQARWVRVLTKRSSQVVDTALAQTLEADTIARAAKETADAANEQAMQNGQLLAAVRASALEATQNSKRATMLSTAAFSVVRSAKMEFEAAKRKKAAEDMAASENAEPESLGLAEKARRTLRAAGPRFP